MLESFSTLFKEEKDSFYIRGINKGLEKGKNKKSPEVVINLIEKFGFDDKQAAAAADVSVIFVKEVRKSFKAG